ncbi:MAG: triple tyrosine motif-containing protein [Bacteroidota bacterium]
MHRFPLFTLLLALCLPLAAQRPVYRYEQGHPLTSGYITALAESQDGFLYVASQASLRRFDGEQTIVLGADFGDLGGSTHALQEGPDGLLWIGHHKGISVYDPAKERYTNYGFPTAADLTDPTKTTVFRLAFSALSQRLYALSDQQLLIFDAAARTYLPAQMVRQQQDSLSTGHCTEIIPTERGDLLLACSGGIFRLEEEQLTLSAVFPDQDQRLRSFSLALTPNEDLLVGGLEVVYHLKKGEQGNYTLKDSLLLSPAEDANRGFCTRIYRAFPHEYYLATNRGLYELHWQETTPLGTAATTTSYRHSPDETNSLSSDQVTHLAVSASGLLWIGTRKGVDRMPIGPTPFTNFQRQPGLIDLCNNHAKGTAVDPIHGLLVVGTTTGLSIYDYEQDSWKCYTPADLPGFRSPYLINVDPGPTPHTFWLLYRKGGADILDLTNPDRPIVRPGIHPADATDLTHAYEVAYRDNGTCYIATGRGIFVYDPKTGDKSWLQHDAADSTSLPDNYCYAVYVDQADQVWVGTRTKGLCRLEERETGPAFSSWRHDPDDGSSLSSNLVLNVFEDEQQRLWVSTPGGISLRQNDGKFRNFSTADGLPHPLSYGIFADQSQQLWTVQGGQITRIRLDQEGKFIVGAGFRQRDGMADDFCVQYGWSTLPDGQLAISHPDGLTLFHPDSLSKDAYLPPVILTEVQLFNQPVTVAGSVGDTLTGTYTLPLAAQRLSSLHLPPGQNFLGLTFAAPEFRPFRSPEYSWRMTDIQEEWASTNGRNYLSFPKLPPGNYALELRSGDPYGTWSEEITRLTITLAAPWYQRTWAYALFSLLMLGAVVGITRFFERQRQRVADARREEREELRRRSARDFHDEAGNHLSKVSLLTTLAERQLEQNDEGARTQVQSMLKEIGSNTQVLREGMRDFIWALDPDNDNAYELALRLKRFGQDLFAHHPGQFNAGPFSEDLNHLPLRADERRHLMLLTKEAMHNSLKHAPAATELRLTLDWKDDVLNLVWSDNGPGMPTIANHDGMGLKSMRARADKLQATLAFESKDGCQLSLQLPISPK